MIFFDASSCAEVVNREKYDCVFPVLVTIDHGPAFTVRRIYTEPNNKRVGAYVSFLQPLVQTKIKYLYKRS